MNSHFDGFFGEFKNEHHPYRQRAVKYLCSITQAKRITSDVYLAVTLFYKLDLKFIFSAKSKALWMEKSSTM